MELREQLRQEEGTVRRNGRYVVYDDATGKPIVKGSHVFGHPTIGWGRNLAGRGISTEEAEALFSQDIVDSFRDCRKTFPWFNSLSENRQRVLVDLVFNMGLANLLGFPKFLYAASIKDWVKATLELMDSDYYRTQSVRVRRMVLMWRDDVSFEFACQEIKS